MQRHFAITAIAVAFAVAAAHGSYADVLIDQSTVVDAAPLIVNGNLVVEGLTPGPKLTLTNGASTRSLVNVTIGDQQAGRLDVLDASILASTVGVLGNAAGSKGTATISGVGAAWLARTIYVGNEGDGTLEVINRADASTSNDLYVGMQQQTQGRLLVSGLGSSLSAKNIAVGSAGEGVLKVLDGAMVHAEAVMLAPDPKSYDIDVANGRGEMVISGDWSRVTAFGVLFNSPSRDGGYAKLTVSDGGNLYSHVIGGGGVEPNSTADILVTGTGSTLRAAGTQSSSFAPGTLQVRDGGQVKVGQAEFHGVTTIAGNGASLTGAELYFGENIVIGQGGLLSATEVIEVGDLFEVDSMSVTVKSGGKISAPLFFHYGGAFVNDGEVSGYFAGVSEELVTGTGHFETGRFRFFSPGNGVGSFSTEKFEAFWNYHWEINALAENGGAAGASRGWDFWDAGEISSSIFSDGISRCAIELHSLDGSGEEAALAGWNPHRAHEWLIATFTYDSATSGPLQADKLQIDVSHFAALNDLDGGTFHVESRNGDTQLFLVFTPAVVPEPSTWALMLVGLAALGFRATRKAHRGMLG